MCVDSIPLPVLPGDIILPEYNDNDDSSYIYSNNFGLNILTTVLTTFIYYYVLLVLFIFVWIKITKYNTNIWKFNFSHDTDGSF